MTKSKNAQAKKKRAREKKQAAAASSASPASSSPTQEPPSKRARMPDGSYTEQGEQPPEDGPNAKKLAKELKERMFFEQCDNILLLCWLMDYKENKEWGVTFGDVTNRAKLLRLCVQHTHLPTTSKELPEMLAAWRRVLNPSKDTVPPGFLSEPDDGITRPLTAKAKARALKAPKPGRTYVRPEPLPESESDSDIEEVTPESEGDLPSEDEEPAKPPAKELPSSAPPGPLPQSASASVASSSAQSAPSECQTCLHPAPVPGKPWKCTKCGYRGDLKADDPVNINLRAMAHTAPAASPSSQGQSTTDTHHTGGRWSLQDKELSRLAAEGPAPTFFESRSVVSVGDARAITSRAYRAATYEPTRDAVVKLIQSGRLRDIGYALPRVAGTTAGENEIGVVGLGARGLEMTAKNVAAPAITSLSQFMLALCANIIPALSEQPLAVQQWAALGRTVVELEARYGWPAASAYATRLLTQRILEGGNSTFAQPEAALLDIAREERSDNRAPRQPGNSGRAAPASASSRHNACNNYNDGHPCSSTPCRFNHVCRNCGDSKHTWASCPDPTPVGQPAPAGRGARRDDRRPRRDDRRSQGGSVVSSASKKQPSKEAKDGDKE